MDAPCNNPKSMGSEYTLFMPMRKKGSIIATDKVDLYGSLPPANRISG